MKRKAQQHDMALTLESKTLPNDRNPFANEDADNDDSAEGENLFTFHTTRTHDGNLNSSRIVFDDYGSQQKENIKFDQNKRKERYNNLSLDGEHEKYIK